MDDTIRDSKTTTKKIIRSSLLTSTLKNNYLRSLVNISIIELLL